MPCRTRTILLFSAAIVSLAMELHSAGEVQPSSSEEIIVSADASPQAKFAAQELALHLEKILGGSVPVRTAGESNISSGLKLIVSSAADSGTSLEEEEWQISPHENGVTLSGGGARGVIYAVYEFLEMQGVRWLAPDETVIPKRDSLVIPTESLQGKPPIRIRYFAWNLPLSTPEWRVRMRLNGINADLPQEMGGYQTEASEGDCHYLGVLVPSTLSKEHPEWFAMDASGSRKPYSETGPGNYCLTNKDLRAFVVERVRARLRETGAKEIWIGQSDGFRHGCYCPECTKEREEFVPKQETLVKTKERATTTDPLLMGFGDGNRWSVNNIRFANEIADSVRDEFPEASLLTLAYAYTAEAPPPDLKPAGNLVVNLAFIDGDWFRPFPPGSNELLNGWAATGARIRSYTYAGSNFGFWWPFPNIISHSQLLHNLAKDGVTEFFTQGTLLQPGAGLVELRAYVSGRMMLNPDADPFNLVKEFCDGYYGPAGTAVAEYVSWYHTYVLKNNIRGNHEWGNDLGWRKWVNEETTAKGEFYRDAALKAVEGNPKLQARVARGLAEVDWARWAVSLLEEGEIRDGQLTFFKPGQEEVGREAAHRFNSIMEKNGFTKLSELMPWRNKDTALEITTREVSTVDLQSDDSTVTIVPELGGRIIRWRAAGVPANAIRMPGPFLAIEECDGMDGGFGETITGEAVVWKQAFFPPGYREAFRLVKKAAGSVVLEGVVGTNFHVTRTFDWGEGVLKVSSTYKNTGASESPLSFMAHLPLDAKYFNGAVLNASLGNGQTVEKELGMRGPLKEEFVIESATGESSITLKSPQKQPLTFNVRFDNEQYKGFRVFQSLPSPRPYYAATGVDVLGRPVVVPPGASVTYVYSIDFKSSGNAPGKPVKR